MRRGAFLPLITVTLVTALAPAMAAGQETLAPFQDPGSEFLRRAAAPAASRCAGAERLFLAVAATPGDGLDTRYDEASGRLTMRYPMVFNQVTEGWNWHPEAQPSQEDYYSFKYLPLASIAEDRGGYRAEDKIGSPQQMRIHWRYDYFFAFANLYDFYPRGGDDDAGFSAQSTMPRPEADRLAGGDLQLALIGRLDNNCLAESTTFWKATSAQPVDFTLKKRYLLGRLEEVIFYDKANGRLLARLAPR